jgi:hypothetical protein
MLPSAIKFLGKNVIRRPLQRTVNELGLRHSARSLSVFTSESGHSDQTNAHTAWMIAATMFAAISTTVATCEGNDVASEKEHAMEKILEKPEQKLKPPKPGEPDSYDNLPDDDEETDCFLCRTHRQGPCRPQWRKFEHCVKDQSGSKDNGSCDKYVKPFEECWKENAELYVLIALDVNQVNVRNIQIDFRFSETKALNSKNDWKEWFDFLKDEGSFKKAIEDVAGWRSLDKFVPYWKRFVILEKKPFIVNTSSIIPVTKDGMSLKVAYAVDQDGLVLGYADYDEQFEIEKAKEEKRPVPSLHKLMITLVPGMTKGVRVVGLYQEDVLDNKTEPKVHLYETDMTSLKDLAREVVPIE